jgi:hypothetical protein
METVSSKILFYFGRIPRINLRLLVGVVFP